MAHSQGKDVDSMIRDNGVIRTVHARRIAELEQEVRELRHANEMLRLHSAREFGLDLNPSLSAVGIAIRWAEPAGPRPPGNPDAPRPLAEFRVLGPIEATVAGRLVALGAPKQRALLTLLISRVGQPVTSDVIAEELWTGQPPPSAMASLQAYVANLRRVLEPDRPPRAPARVLRTSGQGYLLDDRVIAVDARRFEGHATAGWRALDTDDPKRALSEFDAGLALWRGSAYAEAADVTSVMPRAVRLEELRLSVVEGRCAALLGAGAHEVAVAELEAFTLANPLREYGLELLSRALYRAGRQADALSALRTNQGRLTAELGIDPVPALQRLEREILTQDPALDWCPPQPRSRGGVGRDRPGPAGTLAG